MSKAIKIVGVGCASFAIAIVVMLVTGMIVIGTIAPDTSIYLGRQVPKRYMETIRSLELLNDTERIQYFYSDAFFDIKDGFYFVTDEHLVLYSSEWETPETIIAFAEIGSLETAYSSDIWEDGMVYVTTTAGMEVSFPISSERGLDKKFVEAIEKHLDGDDGADPEVEADAKALDVEADTGA